MPADYVMDIEELVAYGQHNCQCPYYASRELLPNAQLVLLPYNYLIDARQQDIMKLRLEGSIVVFDEAHNLESVCMDACSVELSSRSVDQALQELQFLRQVQDAQVSFSDVERIERVIIAFKALVDALELLPPTNAYSSPASVALEMLTTAGATADMSETMLELLTSLTSVRRSGAGLSAFIDAVRTLFDAGDSLSTFYRLHVQKISAQQ